MIYTSIPTFCSTHLSQKHKQHEEKKMSESKNDQIVIDRQMYRGISKLQLLWGASGLHWRPSRRTSTRKVVGMLCLIGMYRIG